MIIDLPKTEWTHVSNDEQTESFEQVTKIHQSNPYHQNIENCSNIGNNIDTFA